MDVIVLAQGAETPPTSACGEDPSFVCTQVFDWTGSELWAKAADFLLGRPLTVLLVLIIAFVANRLARRVIRRITAEMQEEETRERFGRLKRRAGLGALSTSRIPSQRQAQRAEGVGALLRSASSVLIWGIAFITILTEVGIAVGPLLASAGVVGVAIGFGAQNVVKDFLSGVFMLVEDQYGVGDIVDAGEATGVVEGISLRTTRLRSINGTLWHIPNGEIRRVGNFTQEWARALLDIGVSYGTDLDRAATLMQEVADEFARDESWKEHVLAEPEIWGVEDLGADGVAIRLVMKVQPAQQWAIQRELRRRIKARFDAEGVEIPFPQRTLWLRTDLTGATAPPAVEVRRESG